MAVANSLTNQNRQPKFTAVINSDGYKRMINNTLGDPCRAARFVTAITSAVSNNPALQECDAATIVSAGLLGEGLNLSPSPQLGQYYFVPFKQKAKYQNGQIVSPERVTAQFVLGYRGMLQLAQRSGEYKKINVAAIKQGELVRYNRFDDDIELVPIDDELLREQTPTVGYYAMFEYHNGFRKVLYWSKEKMIAHADRYSAAFSMNATGGKYPKASYADYEAGNYDPKDEWKYSSFWYKDFDGMACKTMLRQLLSKWGIMSIDMQKAFDSDMGVIDSSGNVDYVDTPQDDTEPPAVPEPPQAEVIDVEPDADVEDFAALLEG